MKKLPFLAIFLLSLLMISSCNKQQKTDKMEFTYPFQNPSLSIDERVSDLVGQLTLEEKVKQMMYEAPAIERLDIPEYNWWNEALHGVARNGRATVFPQAIGMGATFDTELIYDVASAISDEARAKFNVAVSIGNRARYAGLTFWSPNVNIFRDPRWGRGQETYGEDPYLSGQIGAAFVKGLQQEKDGILQAAACAKHFVVHSGPEKLRHEFDALSSPRDLQETYFPAFKTLVDAGVEGFMCAYNRTNGEACCGSNYLLVQILREAWGFDGYITSDCWAIKDFYDGHNISADETEAAALAAQSGVNLNCGSTYDPWLTEAVKKGLVSEQEIDALLSELLVTRFKLGLFDPAENDPYKDYKPELINSKEHRELARKTAEGSMVLLKNNGVLPVSPEIPSAFVVGPFAADMEVLLANYYGVSGQMVTFLEGIVGRVSPGTKVMYDNGFLIDRNRVNETDWALGEVKANDITFVFAGISRMLEGEEGESILSPYKGDRYDYGLPDNQVEYIKKVGEAKGEKPVVLILTGGSPVDVSEVEEYVDAIIYAWYPGEEGGTALANIIFGDVNPSGKLPITFPKSLDQLPDYEDYRMEGRTYKYMDVDPYFPFGYGMSYTKFSFSEIDAPSTISKEDTEIPVKVKLKNTGEVDGSEVVQLYCSFPDEAKEAPNFRLIGFKKVFLKAREETEVTLNISATDLQTFDDNGKALLIPGKYTLTAGGASPLKRSKELGVEFVEAVVEVD